MTGVHIIGVGIHPFGRTPHRTGLDQGLYAARRALADAGVGWADIQFAFGGSHAAGNADAVLPRLGLTGIPFVNIANGCATGGSALQAGFRAIASGEADLGIVLGFDKHPSGAFTFLPEELGLPQWYGQAGFMQIPQFFAMKIQRYAAEFGISGMTLARVPERASRNGALADHAWRRAPITIEAIAAAPMVSDPLSKYMFCSPSEGGAAVIVASEKKMRELGGSGPRIRGIAVRTRLAGAFEIFMPALTAERMPGPTRLAADAVFEAAGVAPSDVDVAQIQDTDSGAEVINLADSGFCAHGEQERLYADGSLELGGSLPINTDGGCMACGEPIGATGLRQIYENVLQLRGRAERRQVDGARIAYSQVHGMPGLAATAILEA